MNSQQARDRAEASFKKKETQLLENRKAMAEYNADSVAVRAKTARLRALRLARDAAETAQANKKPAIAAGKNISVAKVHREVSRTRA